MRVYLIACVAIVVIALGAFLTLYPLQKRASENAFTTEGARITASWSARQIFSRPKVAPLTVSLAVPTSEYMDANQCVSSAWSMILSDFSTTLTDEPVCEF